MSRYLLSRDIELTAESIKQYKIELIYNLYDDAGPIDPDEANGWFKRISLHEKQLICVLELANNKKDEITGASAILFSDRIGLDLFNIIIGMHSSTEFNAIYN